MENILTSTHFQVLTRLSRYERIHIVCNQNLSSSLKQQVCMIYGPQKRNTTVPKKCLNYDNKMNLSSKQIQKIDVGHKVIYTTHLDLVLSISSSAVLTLK